MVNTSYQEGSRNNNVLFYRLRIVNLKSRKVIFEKPFHDEKELNDYINQNLTTFANKGFNIEAVKHESYYH